MKQIYKVVTLAFLLFPFVSLWAQNAEEYREAAEQGIAEAQNAMGECYYYGQGVTQDNKAVYWFTKAAEQGIAEAQYILGECYYIGLGVPQDDKQAFYWWNKILNNPNASEEIILHMENMLEALEIFNNQGDR